jgi:phenylpropionate dioxygenase-like ring-hydroxylating dioxygenase large terminal subunit
MNEVISPAQATGNKSKPRKSKLADLHTPLLYNFWYVAGFREDFTHELTERVYLNRSLVTYRTEAGEPVALQNRCAHRSFPLSESWLEGDDIRCRYHGAKFNSAGQMIEVPCQANCPKVQLRKYPLKEVGPLVWIWMGEPEAADEADIPDTSWLNVDEGWEFCTGSYHLEGNYLLMMENLMDLTHIPFLHQDTFDFPKSYAAEPVTVKTEGHSLTYTREPSDNYHRNGFLPPKLADEFEGRSYDAQSGGKFVFPGMMYGIGGFTLKDAEEGERESYAWHIPHFVTPETEGTTHYWFFHTRNFAQEDKAFSEKLRQVLITGFEEDREAIKLLQAMHHKDHSDYREIHFTPDTPTIGMRKIVKKLAEREYGDID